MVGFLALNFKQTLESSDKPIKFSASIQSITKAEYSANAFRRLSVAFCRASGKLAEVIERFLRKIFKKS